MDKQMLGIINAGEENRKLKDLVRSRSLSALPVGGRYRTVDFMLSNMVNAGIKNVGLLNKKKLRFTVEPCEFRKRLGIKQKTWRIIYLPTIY